MRHEILAPAGSYAICEAVLAAGADAVYLGGDRFSARAYAPNFSDEDILRALDLAHLHDRKIYLAVNILLKNQEMDRELFSYLKPFYEHGLDAIIVQDYGVFQFVRKNFPDLPIHVSTQASVASGYGASFFKEQGAKRIIPARELCLAEIRNIYDESHMEVECFVHGAMCYCYSGQCLMSSLIGGRSGNRGRCAQPCRLPYRIGERTGHSTEKENTYPLSMKDLCAIDFIPQLCEAGVCAFKIEGRMKSLSYAAGVTKIYRSYLDRYEADPKHYSVSERDHMQLRELGCRDGFTTGYYTALPGGEMRSEKDSAFRSGEQEETEESWNLPKIPLMGSVVVHPEKSVLISVQDEAGHATTVMGPVAQAAHNRPLSEADIRARILRTGGTAFAFAHLNVDSTDSFVSLGQINALRREALRRIQEEILSDYRRTAPVRIEDHDETRETSSHAKLDVLVCTEEQLSAALSAPHVACISLDLDASEDCFFADGTFLDVVYLREVEQARAAIAAAGKQAGFCFPYVFRKDTATRFEEKEWIRTLARFDVLWVRSFDSLGFCLSKKQLVPARIRLDAALYVFSGETWRDFSKLGVGGYTASAELNAGELMHLPNRQGELSVYGDVPLMVSAQCAEKDRNGCRMDRGDVGDRFLVDRYQHSFPIKKNCKECYQVLYNDRPLYLLHRAQEVRGLGFGSHRITFVAEDGAEAAHILDDYRRAFWDEMPLAGWSGPACYTQGHFHRGVD